MAKLNLKEINEQIRLIRKELGTTQKQPFIEGQLKEARAELAALRRDLTEINNDLKSLGDILTSSLSELTKGNFELNLAKKSFRGLISIADKFNDIQTNGVFLEKDKLEQLKLQGEKHIQNLEYALRFGDLSEAARKEIEGQVEALRDEDAGFKKLIDDAEKFQEAVKGDSGVKKFGFLSELSGAIPGLKTLTSMFGDAADAAEKTAIANEQNKKEEEDIFALKTKQREADLKALETGKGLNKGVIDRLGLTDKLVSKSGKQLTGKGAAQKAKGLGIGADDLPKITKGVPKTMSTMMAGIKSLGPALTKALGPIAIIAELVKGLFEADKQVVGLQKTMMLTKSEATSFNQSLQNAAATSSNIAVTGTKVFETFMSLTKEAGFVARFSEETLGSATKLQQVLGISASATSNLAQAAEATGTSLEANYKSTLSASYEMQRQAGTQLDMKQIMEETGAVTGQMRANMGGNTVEIAKAVTQAKLLGTSLEKVAAAGRQMLDFESSIAKEMEAELMTGKQLNLDRARAAALAGDQETVAKELAKNMGDFTEFSKMNVLQQDALASAMGMTSDEMADMLFKQQVMGRTAKELREQGEDELAAKLEAKTAQDQMNAAMDQLKQTFVSLGTSLLPIVNLIGGIASVISMIVGYTQDLLNFLNPFVNTVGEGSEDYQSRGNKAAAQVGSAFGIEDGVIGPDGDIISTSPEDYLIATKTPGEMAGAVSEGGGGVSIDIGPLVAKLDQLIGVVEKGGDVILDGNKVGRNIAMASSKMG